MASEKRRRKFASHMTRANMFLSLKRTALIILSYQCITVDSVKHEGTDDYYNHNVHEPGKLLLTNMFFFYCLRIYFNGTNSLLNTQIAVFYTQKILQRF